MAFLRIVSLILLIAFASAQGKLDGCSVDCGAQGVCVNRISQCTENCEKVCKCNPNYLGDDCSLLVQHCDGVVAPNNSDRLCYNGGTCTKNRDYNGIGGNSDHVEYWCDCSTATGGAAAAYAGHQCEFPHSRSCILGADESTSAFCVNDGTCRELVSAGKPHPGCVCTQGFEGRHCQYEEGTAPAQESGTNSIATLDDGLSAGGVFLVVVIVLTVLTGGMYIFLRQRRKSAVKQTIIEYDQSDLANSSNDLKLETFEGDHPPEDDMEIPSENPEII